jgi:hypothetical protein
MNKKHANNNIENSAITSLLSGSRETVETQCSKELSSDILGQKMYD